MTEVSTAERSVEPQPSVPLAAERPKSKLPWIILTLWALWLAALVILSFPELGRKKLNHDLSMPPPPIR